MQKTGILLTMITLLILQTGCSKTQHNATTEVIDGVTYVHNADIPFTDLKLESDLIITGEDYYEYMNNPCFLNLDDEGNIYLVESGSSTIVVFNPQGKYLKSFSREGEGPGEFCNMGRMDIFPNGDMIIADELNYRYQLLDKDFNYINSFKFEEPIPYNCIVLTENEFVVNGAVFGMGVEAGTPLLKAYNKDFKTLWKSSDQKVRESQSTVYFTSGYHSLALNSKGCIIEAAYLDNSISVYKNGVKKIDISRALPYKATNEMKMVRIKLKGRYIDGIDCSQVSIDVAVDSKDNIYILRFADKSEIKNEDLANGEIIIILEIYNSNGIIQKKSKMRNASFYSDMKIDKDDNFYLLNYHEDGNVLTRYKPLGI